MPESGHRERARDVMAASDPGLLRLSTALRTVVSITLALAVLGPLGVPVRTLVSGALVSVVATYAIRERERRRQAVTLALGLPIALAAVTLGALLRPLVVAGDLFFVVLIFVAVYVRRFGDRGTSLGLMGFQLYFLSLFVGADLETLPRLTGAVVVGFAAAAVSRFLLVPQRPAATLERLRDAFRARLAQLVSAHLDLLEAEGPEEADRALRQVREGTARLHEAALLVQGRLESGTAHEAAARLVQRRIADAEVAAERLGLALLAARTAQRADTLILHLPGAPVPAEEPTTVPEAYARTLRRDLRALRLLVSRPAGRRPGSAVQGMRDRLLGYRDEENLPSAPAAVRDVFRAVGETAHAVLGLRVALDGTREDDAGDSSATARAREELEAEDAAIDAAEEDTEDRRAGLERPTTRAAAQVAVASAIAIVGGELLSEQRWYWAVLTCWIVFINTASTGEILVKSYRRVLGTLLGVVAGVGLAALVGQRTWPAFAAVLVCVFLMYYTAPLSYTLMSFFVTAALGVLYTLLHSYSVSVLVLRVEETALGAACGVVAALLVLPVRTDRRTDDLLSAVLDRLAEVTETALERLSGGSPPGELLAQARSLDEALADLRAATKPLIHPVTPLRARRTTARYVLALLETCAYHARALAATAEQLPAHPAISADPRLRGACARILRNIRAVEAHVSDGHSKETVEAGPSVAALLEPGPPGAPRFGRVTDRVLRHLQRLDEAVVGLARPLGARIAGTPEGKGERRRRGEGR